MEISNQKQIAGNNSQQFQAKNIIINQGVSEEQVREICNQQFALLSMEFHKIAEDVASQRINKFENIFIPKVLQLEKIEQAFTEPKFQFLLKDAQRSAICNDDNTSYEVLSNLLLESINNIKQKKNTILIKQAIKIIGELDLLSLHFFTNLYILRNIFPNFSDYKTWIKNYALYFEPFIINQKIEVPLFECFKLLGLIEEDLFYPKLNFYEYFYYYFDGYFRIGIQKSHDNYTKALNILSSINLVDNILIDNPFYPEYAKISLVTNQHIDSLKVYTDNKNKETRTINQDEIKSIKELYKLYYDDKSKKNEMLELIKSELNNYPIYQKIKTIWDSCPCNTYFTPLGLLLGEKILYKE